MILIKPNLNCNMNCLYCYENQYRCSGHKVDYNLSAVLKTLDGIEKGVKLSLHGGEPLMLPKPDIEKILSAMLDKQGYSSIQTNGLMIDKDFTDMFIRYKTSVGFSFDGLGELNRFRTNPQNTAKIYANMLDLMSKGVHCSILIVVSRANAETDTLLDQLKSFVSSLSSMKISGRLLPCTGDSKYALGLDRMTEVYKQLALFTISNGYRWSPITDMWNSLIGAKQVTCVYRDCDIFCTQSATVILGDGSLSNCMRVSEKDLYIRQSNPIKARDELLPQIDQIYGGCKGCEFFYACHGGCPSHTPDWRDRTILCPMYKELFILFSNIQNFAKISRDIESSVPVFPPGEGIEHNDGNWRHLDSNCRASEHIDKPKDREDHSDGIEHNDGNWRHLDG